MKTGIMDKIALLIATSGMCFALGWMGTAVWAGPHGGGGGPGGGKAHHGMLHDGPGRRQQCEKARTDPDHVCDETCRVQRRRRFANRDRMNDGRNDRHRAMRERMIRFDADGDGVLSEDERAAAHEAMRAEREEERRAKMLKHFDADGDGVLNDEEREHAHDAMGRRRRHDDGGAFMDGSSPVDHEPHHGGDEER